MKNYIVPQTEVYELDTFSVIMMSLHEGIGDGQLTNTGVIDEEDDTSFKNSNYLWNSSE